MSWNPSVRAVSVVKPSKTIPESMAAIQREMEGAAAAAVVMALASHAAHTARRPVKRTNGVASSWVVNGRMEMINRWPG